MLNVGDLKRGDNKSKVFDGVVSVFLIISVLVVLIGLIFIARTVGMAGFIIYFITAILVAAFCLKRSLNDRLSEVSRAWYGIVGGMVAWAVMELGEMLGFAALESKDGVHVFILAGVFIWLLWRYFPVGARFFIFIFFLNWGGHIVINLQKYMSEFWDVFLITLPVYSFTALPAAIIVTYWIFGRSQTRIGRLYAAGWLYLFMFTFIHMTFFY